MSPNLAKASKFSLSAFLSTTLLPEPEPEPEAEVLVVAVEGRDSGAAAAFVSAIFTQLLLSKSKGNLLCSLCL